MRRFKRLLLSLFLVTALVLAAPIIFVSTADFNEYKETIAAELKAASGRVVTIGGSIGVAGGIQPPTPGGSSRLNGSGKASARSRKNKSLLQRLNPFE